MEYLSRAFQEPYMGSMTPGATENLPSLYVGRLFLDKLTQKLYKCIDATINANAWELTDGENSSVKPVLTGALTGVENTVLVVTITNFVATNTYNIVAQGGTFVNNNDGTISWTLPNVTVDIVQYLRVYSTEQGKLLSLPTEHSVNVQNLIVTTADQILLYENTTMSTTQFPTTTTIDLTGNTLKATDDGASATSLKVNQDGGDGDWGRYTPSMVSKISEYCVANATCHTIYSNPTVSDIFGDSSCINHFSFDSNSNDSVGGLTGTETSVTHPPSRFSNGLRLSNGTGDTVISSRVNLSGSVFIGNVSTVSFWFTPDIANDNTAIMGINTATFTSSQVFAISNTGDIIINQDGVTNHTIPVGFYPTVGIMYHYVVVLNGTAAMVYVNGSLRGSITVPLISLALNMIGGYVTISSSFNMNGKLEQLRVFNKAVTAQEVCTLYNEGNQPISKSNTAITILGNITSGDKILLNDGATTTLKEFDTTSNVTVVADETSLDPFGDRSQKAFYKLNNNVNDEMGTYNGTAVGTVGYGVAKYGDGMVGTGLTDFGMDASIPEITSNGGTLSLWGKFSGGTDVTLVEAGTRTNSADSFSDFTLQLQTTKFAVATRRFNPTYIETSYFTAPVIGRWYHIVVTWTLSGVKLYLDGKVVAESITSASSFTFSNLRIGRTDRTGTGFQKNLNGSIDQVRIFNRDVTDCEVQQLFHEKRSTINLTPAALTSTPTIVAKDTADLSVSLVPTGGADNFIEQLPATWVSDKNGNSDNHKKPLNVFNDGNEKLLYTLNGTPNESSGAFNGTVGGTVTYPSTGPYDKSALFNGSSRIQSLIKPSWIVPAIPISISLWYKKTIGTTGFVFQIGKYSVYHHGAVDFSVYLWNNTNASLNTKRLAVTTIPDDGNWRHVTFMSDGIKPEVYVNGIKLLITDTVASVVEVDSRITIGSSNDNTLGFTGEVAQVRVFNRVLTPTEITYLATNQTPSTITQTFPQITKVGRDIKVKMIGKKDTEPTRIQVSLEKII
jgi:hypothetical protein